MELELKHLAPYLPYGLKLRRTTKYKEQEGTPYQNDTIEMSINLVDVVVKNNSMNWDVKPILRPLSEVGGDYAHYITIQTCFESVHPQSLNYVLFINTEDKTYLSDILEATDHLFRNHFDVFGLIEKGLAIDINTIK